MRLSLGVMVGDLNDRSDNLPKVSRAIHKRVSCIIDCSEVLIGKNLHMPKYPQGLTIENTLL